MEEIWKDIDDYEGLYQVSNFGRVRSLDRYVDNNGVLHSTFTYREMTGKDEEAINRGDVKANV